MKEYEFGICCFSAKHTALRRKCKDWLARNQDHVSKWKDISTRELLFLCYKNQTTNYYTTVEVDEILAPSVPYNKH
jgi:hypothetical protein